MDANFSTLTPCYLPCVLRSVAIQPHRLSMISDPSGQLGQGPANSSLIDLSLCPLLKIPQSQTASINVTFNADNNNAVLIYDRVSMKVICKFSSQSPRDSWSAGISAGNSSSLRLIISCWTQPAGSDSDARWCQIPFKDVSPTAGPPYLYGFEDKLDSGRDNAIDWNDVIVRVGVD